MNPQPLQLEALNTWQLKPQAREALNFLNPIANPRKLEHECRMIRAGIPYTLPEGREDNDVPTFWLLL